MSKTVEFLVGAILGGVLYDGIKEALDSKHAHEVYDALGKVGTQRGVEARKIMAQNFGHSSGGSSGHGGSSNHEDWYEDMKKWDDGH